MKLSFEVLTALLMKHLLPLFWGPGSHFWLLRPWRSRQQAPP